MRQQLSEQTIKRQKISILSYNTLIEKASYTPTVKKCKNWSQKTNIKSESQSKIVQTGRKGQLLQRMLEKNPDIICLQEIRQGDPNKGYPNFNSDFYMPIRNHGYDGVFHKRNIGGQFGEEGLAILYKPTKLSIVEADCLYYEDGTGRLAQFIKFITYSGKSICNIINTHTSFPGEKNGQKQIQKLVNFIKNKKNVVDRGQPCIVCGDLNLDKRLSNHCRILQQFGKIKYLDPFDILKCNDKTFALSMFGNNCPGFVRDIASLYTRLDYFYASQASKPVKVGTLGDISKLFSNEQPSDHLPVYGQFQLQCLQEILQNQIDNKYYVKDSLYDEQCQRKYLTANLKLIINLLKQIQVEQHIKVKQVKNTKILQIFNYLPLKLKNQVYFQCYEHTKYSDMISNFYNIHDLDYGKNVFRKFIPYKQLLHLDRQITRIKIKIINQILQTVVLVSSLIQQYKVCKHLQSFIRLFDSSLSLQLRGKVYFYTYQIACEQGKMIDHPKFGELAFRTNQFKEQNHQISNILRVQALLRLEYV